MFNSPIAEETFHLTAATFRVVEPYRLAKPFQDAGMGPFESFGFAVLTLSDADGTTADVPLSPGALPVLENLFLPRLLGTAPVPHGVLFNRLYWAMRNEGFRSPHVAGPLGSIDLALHGIAAHRTGQPLHRFLGATRDWVGVYACGGGTNLTETELLREASAFAEQGFSLLKIKVGREFGRALERDVSRVKALRRHLGPGVGLAVDANQVWSVADALRFVGEVADQDLRWLEEPVHSADLTGLRALCSQLAVPVAVGESEVCGLVFSALADAGVRHLQPQPLHLSSVSEWLAVRDLATNRHLELSAGGFSHLAASLVATANEAAHTELLVDIIGPMTGYFSVQPTLRAGRFYLPAEPGLSVRFDWEKIQRRGQIQFQKHWTVADFGPIRHTVL